MNSTTEPLTAALGILAAAPGHLAWLLVLLVGIVLLVVRNQRAAGALLIAASLVHVLSTGAWMMQSAALSAGELPVQLVAMVGGLVGVVLSLVGHALLIAAVWIGRGSDRT